MAFDPAIPALGNPDGDVTIVEFVDYQCPYCKLCFGEIDKLFSEDPKVRVVMKDWPVFGEASVHAARMALATRGGRDYAAAVSALMANDRKLSERRVDSLLADAGIDLDGVRRKLAEHGMEINALLARNAAQARDFRLAGTPALMIGGTLYKHGLPVEAMREAIAEHRSVRS